VSELSSFEIALDIDAIDQLHERLDRARWPGQPAGEEWALGTDLAYLRELCEHWRSAYDPGRLESRLNALPNHRWNGIHLIWARAEDGGGLPVVLIHGWPGGPIEFLELIPLLVEAGHDVVAPSLPGFAFSEIPDEVLNVAAVAARLRALVEDGLGYERYVVQGGDWGGVIAARMAFEAPDRAVALHVNAPSVLPLPPSLDDPPLSEAEGAYLEAAQRWRLRRGFHLLVQSAAPQSLAYGLTDSPVGLAGWLVEKYREWSDCDGDVERRFSKDELCDFLTMYWATGTIASSMRLYLGERRDRWRLAAGERIEVPAAVADFPKEMLRPPREWAERTLDLRRWTEMPRGGHFAAFEEPELLADDVVGFLGDQGDA
jgi:pimeloyl-ACP methyl ester carboxylesterase